jgi:serine-type D-Ala-D-Ala carboxypeptidase (penicillin-binding protein 5/6)
MKRIATILFSLLFLSLSVMTASTPTLAFGATANPAKVTPVAKAAPKPPAINAGASVLMDLNSGEVLYSKNMNYKYGPASTTKIMTALLTLENCKLEDVVVVGKKPPFEGGSKIYILEGEKLTIEQMMYGLMLTSGNDVANALAEHISGSVEEFAKLMTKRAKEIGCLNTHFSNANGLKNDNHYTSAYDLALITRKAMESPIFRKVVSTVNYQIPPTNKQKQIRYLHNHNKMLSVKIDKYPGADGVKTGYTIKSKYTYVGSATRNGRTLIAVFLFDNKGFYKETANLFNYGFKNFYNKKLYAKTDLISYLKPKGTDLSIPVYPEKDIEVILKKAIL